MIGRMIAPSADDVAAALYAGERLRKLRFLMTDNTLFPSSWFPPAANPGPMRRSVL